VNRGAATRSGRIGVDLGGTKIEIVALDEAGAIAVRRRVASPSHDYAAIVETIGALVEEVEAEFDAPCTVGVGTPGAVSRTTELMKNANSTVLIGRPLERDLRARLGREVRIANDANCFALSEASDGAAAGLSCVFGAILGTGVGGGIVVDGRPLTGRNAIAGEWGHNPLPWAAPSEIPGPRCYCGKNGCIEAFLSGPSLVRDARANGIEVANVQALLAAADAGDAAASLTVVLGGGVSNLGALYEELPRRLPAYVFSDTVLTPVLRPAHGDSSGVRGAAWLWPSGAKPPACKIS
jgi:fructokinase